MAKIKYDPSIIPFVNEHYGYTFQPGRYGQVMMAAQRESRKRNARQWDKQHSLMKAVREWRNMDPATQTNWNNFAATYPQPTQADPDVYLSGYQCFLKRNSYCFLNHGIESDFLTEPELNVVNTGEITAEIAWSDSAIDATENYIKNFGILPTVGDTLLCRIIPYDEYSGQFFAFIDIPLEVTEIYLDGLFITVNVPDEMESVTCSVYLSYKNKETVNYFGTKCRYMGCFTKKKFTELTDTPDSYTGKGGWQVAVNALENALEFIEGGGGGGLSCADLKDCPYIQSIVNAIQNIADEIITINDSSIPAINYGNLVNWFYINNLSLILQSGWRVLTFAEAGTLKTYLGGFSLAGGALKELGTIFWQTPNTGATNSAKYNGRAAGQRTTVGSYAYFNQRMRNWCSDDSSSAQGRSYDLYYNSSNFITSGIDKKYGISCRPMRDASGISDGVSGVYIGNNGRIYRTIVINEWEFVADNFAETLYLDGTPIPEVNDNAEWAGLSTPAWCSPNGDSANI